MKPCRLVDPTPLTKRETFANSSQDDGGTWSRINYRDYPEEQTQEDMEFMAIGLRLLRERIDDVI